MAVFLGCTSTGWVGLCFLWFFVQELLEAQPAVVLVLKRLRRRGKWLEVSSDRLGELGIVFVAGFLGCTSTGRVGLCFLWFFVQEFPKAQPAVVLVLKASQKTGQRLKVSSDRLGIDDTFKRFRLSMHFLTIIYL